MHSPAADSATLGFVAALYDAASDAGGWPDVLARAAALTGAAAAAVTFAEREAGAPWRAERVEFGSSCVQVAAPARWQAERAGDVVRAPAPPPCGHRALAATSVAADGRAAVEFVLHWAEAHGAEAHGAPAAAVAWAERVLPHLARVRDARRRWRALADASTSRAAALDALGPACLAVDAGARVLWTNAGAALFLACRDGLLVRGDRLGAAAPEAEAQLRTAVRRCAEPGVAADGGGDGRGHVTSCPRRAPAGPLVLTVLPLAQAAGAATARAALVVVRASDAPDHAVARRHDTATRFHLTPAEDRVAGLVCEGRSVAEIAAGARVSAGTVRNHLKSVFAKTGVRRQAELVARLLTAGAAPGASIPNGTGGGARSAVP